MSQREKRIGWAAEVLGLPETATMEKIKESYRDLVVRWHPDTCDGDPELCRDMIQRINQAYEIVIRYCRDYEYSFREEEIEKAEKRADYQRWWRERFGDDPIWGGTKNTRR